MTEAPTQEAPPDPLVSRAVRLFTFLGRAQQLRNPSVTDVDAYRRDGAVHWLHGLPEHPALQIALRGGTPTLAEPVLRIARVARLDPPRPATLLRPWLDGATDDARRPPELRTERYVDTPEPDEDPAAPPRQQVEEVADHPDVLESFDGYVREWSAWAEQELRDEPIRTFYGDLFSTYVTATGHPEELELVVAAGLLAWRPDHGTAVRRHLLTTPATLTFDADSGSLTVAVHESADGPRVEVEMLDPSVLGDPSAVNDVREQARAEPAHPLDRDRAGELARRLVHLLAADAEYRDQDERVDGTARPIAAFAPAIILRRRSQQGLVEIFQRIVAEIERSGRVPDGIRPLVDADHVPAAGPAAERSDGAVVRVDDEPFLPLPVNDTQLRILRQVDTHAQTLIQGPPGTGKTHTAAVLISHLLAQGKRVLITAQTDRALKEVRDKLPEEIRPLAVSVVGASREDMSDLRVAVERIGTTAAEYDAADADRTIDDHLAAIDVLRRLRAELYHRLVEARSARSRSMRSPGTAGRPRSWPAGWSRNDRCTAGSRSSLPGLPRNLRSAGRSPGAG